MARNNRTSARKLPTQPFMEQAALRRSDGLEREVRELVSEILEAEGRQGSRSEVRRIARQIIGEIESTTRSRAFWETYLRNADSNRERRTSTSAQTSGPQNTPQAL